MTGALTKCRVLMSGFTASKQKLDNSLPNAINMLSAPCRVCRVFYRGREHRQIVAEYWFGCCASILLKWLELNDAGH